MSKLSQLHAELSEQAAELGFESIEQAEQAGYEVDYENARLIEPQEAAHEAWLKEREQVLEELRILHEQFVEEDDLHYSIVVAKAIKIIEEAK